MKAEHRKHLQENALQSRLKTAWSNVGSNSPTANKVWMVILAALVIGLGWVIYSRYATDNESYLWSQLDVAQDLPALEKIAKDHPKTTQGLVARFHISRVKSLTAMDQIGAPNADRAAIANDLEDVRRTYGELAKAERLPVEMTQEALMQLGRVEEVLASVPNADKSGTMRGTLDTAMQHYDDLAKRYPQCFFAQQAVKRSEDIRAHKSEIEQLYTELAGIHAKSSLPQLPSNLLPAETPPSPPSTPGPALPITPTPEPAPPTPAPAPPK